MLTDAIAEQALAALRMDNPKEAKEKLEELIAQAPDRIDLRHAFAVTLVRMGEAKAAKLVASQGIEMAYEQKNDTAATLLSPLYLVLANACEELYQPLEAEKSYQKILEHEEENPYARQRYAYLLFAMGELDQGLDQLAKYLEHGTDEVDSLKAHEGLRNHIERFMREDIHPKNFLQAHRESYVEEFNKLTEDLEAKGWYAEAARMFRNYAGELVPIIPEGCQPYAGVRVDVVNSENGQPGRIGEGPFIVALAGYEIFSQAAIVSQWPGHPFTVWCSSVCPWNHLAIHIRMQKSQDLDAVDPCIGSWYEAGFHGAFGEKTHGMLHEISNPENLDERSVQYYVDCGRARMDAVPDLLSRLENLHAQHPIESILIGKGFLPRS